MNVPLGSPAFYFHPMSQTANPIQLWKLAIPIAIGVSVSAYLVASNLNLDALKAVQITGHLVFWLLISALTVVSRDAAFMYKVRLSTGNQITWAKTFQTITLWEFGVCITPKISIMPFVLYLLIKSGISSGRSVAILMLNGFFDNLAFVAVFTTLYLFIGNDILTFSFLCPDLEGHQIMQGIRHFADLAWIGYVLILSACTFLGTALFVMPHTTKKFFHQLAEINWLSRFKQQLIYVGDEIEMTSNEFKNKPRSFWVKMSVATLVNWVSRYLLAVSLFYAFAVKDISFLHALSRQYVLWIFTAIPSTPGASGVAELSFIALNCEFMPAGLSTAIALVWRLYSYYLYILLGLIVLPKWAKQIAS